MSNKEIHLVGGGLVGSLSAVYLAQRGFNVTLYERRPDMRREQISAGRSINLALTARGLKSLQEIGLADEVMKLAIPMKGRMLHDREGNTTYVPYGQKAHEVINSVSRGELNKLLLTAAEKSPNVTVHFNHRCTEYDLATSTLTFVDEKTGVERQAHAPRVIGTDGAGSPLRKALKATCPDFRLTEEVNAHGYKELTIPACGVNGFAMEKEALHIWPRGDFMLIALPNIDGSFTLTLFFAHKGEQSFESLTTPEQVRAFFSEYFADAAALIPDLTEMFFANPIGNMVTVKCAPWHYQDKLLLIGDAAHAIVPFYGQGMNCAFEDASTLARELDLNSDWAQIFAAVDAERKPNGDAIADMALENFVEMRSTVADPKFQLKKQVGFELERRHPGRFIPRYSMVVFHPEIPYAEARRLGIAQDTLLSTLCRSASTPEDIDWQQADQLVQSLYP